MGGRTKKFHFLKRAAVSGTSVSVSRSSSCDGGNYNSVVSPESVPQQGHEERIVHRYVAASSLFRKDSCCSLDYVHTKKKSRLHLTAEYVVHTLPQNNER